MSTTTEITVKVTVQAQPELEKAVRAGLNAKAKADSLFDQSGVTLRTISERNGWERSDARSAMQLAYASCFGLTGFSLVREGKEITVVLEEGATLKGKDGGEQKLTVEAVREFFKAKGPDVSKCMSLAFPAASWPKVGESITIPFGADPLSSPEKELKTVRAHNEKCKTDGTKCVGVNKLLEVARGNLSASEAISPTPPSVPTPAPVVPSPELAAQIASVQSGQTDAANQVHEEKMSVEEKFGCALAAFKRDGLTLEQATRQVQEAFKQ
jgi:hypothetical protein